MPFCQPANLPTQTPHKCLQEFQVMYTPIFKVQGQAQYQAWVLVMLIPFFPLLRLLYKKGGGILAALALCHPCGARDPFHS